MAASTSRVAPPETHGYAGHRMMPTLTLLGVASVAEGDESADLPTTVGSFIAPARALREGVGVAQRTERAGVALSRT